MKKHSSSTEMAEAIKTTEVKVYPIVRVDRLGKIFEKTGPESQKYGIYLDCHLVGKEVSGEFTELSPVPVQGEFTFNKKCDKLPEVGCEYLSYRNVFTDKNGKLKNSFVLASCEPYERPATNDELDALLSE